ncbi:site-specific integrase [Telmatocola sphagniphila]|uniref:Site-specific integrase n=1 Tax=Telmatocola sphagniphila TaxID=1123043 RepID=A0A8E6B2A0_9BACT|nr:site-specific integrase [Telmatocola sphagniphila]QVL30780.1 site-specific integrase [Telmatocola sphagniphila]
MASLQKKNQSYYCQFLFQGKRYTVTIGQVSDQEANAFVGKIEHLLMRIRQKLLAVPKGVKIVDFLLTDGQVTSEPLEEEGPLTLEFLRDLYLQTHGNGALEANTLYTAKIHLKHIERTLEAKFNLRTLSSADLQKHINRRVKAKGLRGKKLSGYTIRKEIKTLRAVWNWAKESTLLKGEFPANKLAFPKIEEKPPFQTWPEIEKRLSKGNVTEGEAADLWDCVFLTLPEIGELLDHVRVSATHPWIYPMFCFAAHTGARRSELLRLQVSDIDLEAKHVFIREKKKSKTKSTLRRIPISGFLIDAMQAWLAKHPGGAFLFGQSGRLEHGKKSRTSTVPITEDEAHDHFKRTLAGSKWKVLRGWHVLRHSFASNCAAKGIDQRLIDSWMGHTTEIRRRYLHLIPTNEQQALSLVFDG